MYMWFMCLKVKQMGLLPWDHTVQCWVKFPFAFSLLSPDYALHHPSQMLKSSYYFFFQLPYLPELMLSINDFKVSLTQYTTIFKEISTFIQWRCKKLIRSDSLGFYIVTEKSKINSVLLNFLFIKHH